MSTISNWWRSIHRSRQQDQATEQKHGIRSGEKNWVTPADIEALEEAKVPWLREKRRHARRQQH